MESELPRWQLRPLSDRFVKNGSRIVRSPQTRVPNGVVSRLQPGDVGVRIFLLVLLQNKLIW